MKTILVTLRIFLILAVITGCVYPLFITGIGLAFFPERATGSLIRNAERRVIGSALIAQPFHSDRYFWPRPSAGGYGTMPSGASNLSWTSKQLLETVEERKRRLIDAHGVPESSNVPADLLFASGSGLEPYITPEAARFQARRVAGARGLELQHVSALIGKHTVKGDALGKDVVNVMTLNADLDGQR